MKAIDTWVRASTARRALAAVVSVWIGVVAFLAAKSAYLDGLEYYKWNALLLLLVVLPAAVAVLIYAYTLINPRLRLALWGLIAVIAIIWGATSFWNELERRAAVKIAEDEERTKTTRFLSAYSAYREECEIKAARKGLARNSAVIADCISDRSGVPITGEFVINQRTYEFLLDRASK